MSQKETANATDDVQETVTREPNESLLEQLPVGEGVVAGSGAFLLAYLFFHQLVTFSTTASGASTKGPSGWVTAGWYFFASHNVPVQAGGETAAINVLPNLGVGSISGGWPIELLVLFGPALLLAGAGYLVVSWEDPDNLMDTVGAAATIAVPYLALSVVAALLMTHSYTNEQAIMAIVDSVEPLAQQFGSDGGVAVDDLPNSLEVGVSLTDAVIFAGIIYPVVFGVIGGAIAKKEIVVEEISAKLN